MQLFDSTFTAINLAMGAAGMRQQAIAGNISNVNTPDYKRVDVAFDEQLRSALAADTAGDKGALDGLRPEQKVDGNISVRADGSSVDVDQEMAFLAENNIRYNALVQLASKELDTLKYVISDGRR